MPSRRHEAGDTKTCGSSMAIKSPGETITLRGIQRTTPRPVLPLSPSDPAKVWSSIFVVALAADGEPASQGTGAESRRQESSDAQVHAE